MKIEYTVQDAIALLDSRIQVWDDEIAIVDEAIAGLVRQTFEEALLHAVQRQSDVKYTHGGAAKALLHERRRHKDGLVSAIDKLKGFRDRLSQGEPGALELIEKVREECIAMLRG